MRCSAFSFIYGALIDTDIAAGLPIRFSAYSVFSFPRGNPSSTSPLFEFVCHFLASFGDEIGWATYT